MNEIKPNHHDHEGSESTLVTHAHHPYWKRAHRDWRVWLVVIVMLIGMMIYVVTLDFALVPRSQAPVPPSGAVRK